MAYSFPTWVKWTLRVIAWAAWQLFVLFVALVVYANLFSEYGIYTNRFCRSCRGGVLSANPSMARHLATGAQLARVSSRRWDVEVFADLLREIIVDFRVARNTRRSSRYAVDVDGMVAAFA
jgi:hypothetical protein